LPPALPFDKGADFFRAGGADKGPIAAHASRYDYARFHARAISGRVAFEAKVEFQELMGIPCRRRYIVGVGAVSDHLGPGCAFQGPSS
jgi:hypothetical protein